MIEISCQCTSFMRWLIPRLLMFHSTYPEVGRYALRNSVADQAVGPVAVFRSPEA